MKIGELARMTGTPVETIRYYEREGLVPKAARTASNYRIYGKAHAERLSFIRNCRNLDMALSEIRALLQFKEAPSESCEASVVLDEHIEHVATRITELQALKEQLENLRTQCQSEHIDASCSILDALSQNMPAAKKTASLRTDHVHGTHAGINAIK